MSLPSRPPARITGGHPAVDPDQHPVVHSEQYVALYAPGRAPAHPAPRAVPDAAWPDPLWQEAPRPRAEPADEPVIDVGWLREVLTFPWRAARRHRRLVAAVFAAVCAAAAVTAVIAPRKYDVWTTILAQRNFVMPALGNPRRSVPAESDAPTRMASEAVLNRANLLALIDETKLEQSWSRIRSPLGKARDALQARSKGPMSAAERRDRLVDYLGATLWVATDEGTVRIGIRFPDPQLGLALVEGAQRNFLNSRHESEETLIRESIGILEQHVANAQTEIETALGEVRQYSAEGNRRNSAAWDAAGLGVPAPRRAAPRNPAVLALERDLVAKRGALAAAEASRAQRQETLRARLAELRGTLGAAHPEVVSAEQSLQALAAEPSETVALRAAERAAAAQLAAAGGGVLAAQAPAPTEASLTRAALARLAAPSLDTLEDPKLTYARSRLKIAIADHEDLLDRVQGARIELETARAAFKHRYGVVTPPQLPKRASTPNLPLLIVGGLFLGVTLSLFTALAVDLATGRVVETWQVSRFVGLPVLGEVPRT